MFEQENGAWAHLRVESWQSMSSALVSRVNEACDRAAGDEEIVFFVHLPGFASAPGEAAQPGPVPEVGIRLVNQWERALRRLERLPRITLSVVEGVCQGPAMEVLLATDYRIASSDARLRLPLSGQGTWPGMGVFRTVQQLGLARARELVLMRSDVTSAHAATLGLVNEVADDLAGAVNRTLERWEDSPGGEIAIRRELLFDALTTTFEDAVGLHLAACDRDLRRG